MRLPSSSGSAPASAARSQTGESDGSTSRPSTPARPPARTRPGSARPPKSSVRPVTTMVLPAPVSPVTTVSPGPNSSVASSIAPRPRMCSSVSAPREGAARLSGAFRGVVVRDGTAHLLRDPGPVGGEDVAGEHVGPRRQLPPRPLVVLAGTGVAEPADRQPELGHQPVTEVRRVHAGDAHRTLRATDVDPPADRHLDAAPPVGGDAGPV